MSIRVLSPGLLSSIQDRGRFGYARFGVPVSGVMDRYSAGMANLLVGNPVDSAVLEVTVQGPKLLFQEDTFMAVGGLDAKITIDGKKASINESYVIKKGQTLQIQQITEGVRVYLAVKNGFRNKKILDSRSFYTAITGKNKIEKGDLLPSEGTERGGSDKNAVLKFKKAKYHTNKIQVYPGPEWNLLPSVMKEDLLKHTFHISKSNSRMAYPLEEKIENNLPGILTQPVLPGTVQFTPAGNLIILMRDCQVSGGYPRIFQLAENSINNVAQKRTEAPVKFELISY